MKEEILSERERRVLEAVVQTYVETAEPTGSQTVARRLGLGISPATIRTTMSDLEEKGYLNHPHTSAGRVPTDLGYRHYVDTLLTQPRPVVPATEEIRWELKSADRSGVELLLHRAAQLLGLLTSELGMAIGPGLTEAILDGIELVPITEGRILLVLELRTRGPRTVFVDVPAHVSPGALIAVAQVLNERLCGHSLAAVRATLAERLRDAAPEGDRGASELLNVFIQSADGWLDPSAGANLLLGRASVLADQPEFQSGERLKGLLELTERPDLLTSTLSPRIGSAGLTISIGNEHADPALRGFTIITSGYHAGDLRGVIGVMGPTRMPYERIISLVEGTSSLVSEFLTGQFV
ncbi:MAG: heat-inducible transcriptional repressor HrcA [Gemmatimonadota bacterium]|jgi:heat-inducible transcriptional repressor|nr:heat-inducible transcriptional repressor HrcA [Gemmatimonadota bacterium]